MKVYLVYEDCDCCGDNGTPYVTNVFSKEEKAYEYMKETNEKRGRDIVVEVVEMELQ